MHDMQAVPADLRQFIVSFDAFDAAWKQSEALTGAYLLRLFKQHLHAEANAEEGLLLCCFQDSFQQAGVFQRLHGIRECAHTGQNNAGSIREVIQCAGNFIVIAQKIE